MEQKKSILLVYYKLFKPGGVAKVLTNLANALSERPARRTPAGAVQHAALAATPTRQ